MKIDCFLTKTGKIQLESSVRSLTNIKVNDHEDAGSEILIAVTMKSTIFWDVMLCSPAEVH
jgi:hypothetical protein